MSTLSARAARALALTLLALPASAQDYTSQLEFIAEAYAESGGFAGAVLVSDDGWTALRAGYGLANREWGVENAPDTRFRLGSLTKSFTAALVLELREQGLVELDAPISRYLPDYRADTGERVSVHQLLNHTSGIPSYTNDQEFMREHTTTRLPVADFVEQHCSGDLLFEPGSRFAYNNSGYFLLGAMIEAITGQTYEQALQELILTPFGLEDTGYEWNERVIERRASGYKRVAGGALRLADHLDMSIPYAAGSLYSTVDDMLRWHAILSDERLLEEESRALMYTPGLDGYGYGWGIGELAHEDGPRMAHSGGIPGFSTNMIRRPGAEHVVVVLSNMESGSVGGLSRALFALLEEGALNFPASEEAVDSFGMRSKFVQREVAGLGFTEGPLALDDDTLWFNDLRAKRLYQRTREGLSVLLEDSDGINGLARLPDGRVVGCRGLRGDVIAIDPESMEIEVLADSYAGAAFNKPNDLVVAADGGLWFSDPAYPGGPGGQEVEAVYYRSPDGELRRTRASSSDGRGPNGLALSPDGLTLYLACSGRRGIWQDQRPPLSAFPVLEGGALGEPRTLAAMVADGMAVDEEGTLYVCAPDERAVVAFSAQGDERGRLHMPESPSNCAFTGRGRRMLDITARGSVYSVRMQVAGAP